MSDHAIYSASASAGWLNCPGYINANRGLPESTSKYADEGTAAHGFASMTLENGWDHDQLTRLVGEVGFEVNGKVWPLTTEMAEHVWSYAELVCQYMQGGSLLVEQRVDYSRVLQQESAFGTSDVVIIHPTEITVVDLKYGAGEPVGAEGNTQLLLYALGALEAHDFVYDFQTVRMIIYQPRISDEPSEWVQTVEEVRAFGEKAKAAALETVTQYKLDERGQVLLDPELGAIVTYEPPRIKGSKQCRWCKAKPLCPAITMELDATVIDDFKGIGTGFDLVVAAEPDRLSYYMDNVDLVEQWAKAVRAEVERRLIAGIPVEGYKLVEGRMGNRAWVDETEAEGTLKRLRLKVDEMYTKKVISPTAAEKLLKKTKPKLWAKVNGLITRSAGKPSVAPATDPSPEISLAATPADFAAIVDDSAGGLC